MAVLTAFSFLAGVVTVLSPCILPLLPLLLAGSAGEGRARPWGVVTGFVLSFTLFTLSLSALVNAFRVSPDILRWVAAVLIAGFGLTMVLPALKHAFLAWASQLMPQPRTAVAGRPAAGFSPGLGLGFTLGLVWTPCAGPIMASVITLAATQRVNWQSGVITLAYSVGTALPMVLFLLGGRGVINRLSALKKNSARIQRAFGLLMILTSVSISVGWDRVLQTRLLEAFPGYGEGLTALEENPEVLKRLEALEGGD